MSVAEELKQLVYAVYPALSEHAIILTGDKRPGYEILIDLAEKNCAETARLQAIEQAARGVIEQCKVYGNPSFEATNSLAKALEQK